MKKVVLFYLRKFQRVAILELRILRRKNLLKCYNVRITFKINQEMQWFSGKISLKWHVKFKYAKKSKVTRKWFQRPVYGKPSLPVTQILNYQLAETNVWYSWSCLILAKKKTNCFNSWKISKRHHFTVKDVLSERKTEIL